MEFNMLKLKKIKNIVDVKILIFLYKNNQNFKLGSHIDIFNIFISIVTKSHYFLINDKNNYKNFIFILNNDNNK